MAVTWKKLAYEEDVITKATFTTKGDILVTTAASTPARLAVGDNNFVLTADSGEASGVKWATPAAPAAHKDSHDPEDGGDALDCAAAAEITGVQAAAEGSAHSFARSDHAHQIQASIADDHILTVDDADAADDQICVFTATGVEGWAAATVAAAMALDDIGVPDAAVDFNGQQAEDMVLHTSADVPETPVLGKIYYDTDTYVYVCTSAA